MKKKCLFLGYNNKKTKLINFLKKKNFLVVQTDKDIFLKNVKKYDLIISFGYKKIIPNSIIENLKKPIINLHIGYLPFNRGYYPNLWSFLENTPSGVTIHEIDKGIDTGDIIFQKKIDFKKKNKTTFSTTYKKLKDAIEDLFIVNFDKIKNYSYKKTSQRGISTYHKKNELPKFIKWNMNIVSAQKKYDKFLKDDLKKNLTLIDQIQNVRKNNNINWMDILRLGMISSPKEAKQIIKKISSDDDQIGLLLRKIGKN